MTTDLETELRAALRDRVAHVTPDRLLYGQGSRTSGLDERDEVVADVIPLQPVPTKHRRRPSVLLTAAAVAAGLAVTGAVLVVAGQGGRVTPGGSSAPSGQTEPIMPMAPVRDLTIPFTVRAESEWALVQYHATAEGISLGYSHGPFQISVAPRKAPFHPDFGAGAFQIGNVPARYNEVLVGAGPPVEEDFDPTVSLAPRQWWSRTLLLQLRDGTQVSIEGEKGSPTAKNTLLKWAEQLDFDLPTKLPSPFRLAHAPQGTSLVEVNWVSSSDVDPNRDVWESGTPYRFEATYQPPSAVGPNIGISLQSWRPENLGQGMQSEVVAGHPAFVSATQPWQALTVEFGDTSYVTFGETFGHTTRSATHDELVAAAESVTIAPNSADPSTWFDAAEALPVD